jgi:hypothetical protein
MTTRGSTEGHRPRAAGRRRITAMLLGVAALLAAPFDAWANCRPSRPRPTVVLDGMGPCAFDPQRLTYAGEPAQQAACLLRPVAKLGRLGPLLQTLPQVLAERVGQAAHLPTRESLSAYLSAQGLNEDFAAHLWLPVSRARDNDAEAPTARYLVIHDTSGPFLGRRPFPADIDTHRKINNLAGHRCADGWESAHVVINRAGGMLLGHDLAIPWRATKFERAVNFDDALKGLFLHVEMVQPRRGEWRGARKGRKGRLRDSIAPVPGFSAAQYDRLALVYTIASVRAERWLIPAFHAVVDGDSGGGHDDPQNFVLGDFAASLGRLLERFGEPEGSVAGLDEE